VVTNGFHAAQKSLMYALDAVLLIGTSHINTKGKLNRRLKMVQIILTQKNDNTKKDAYLEREFRAEFEELLDAYGYKVTYKVEEPQYKALVSVN
jgi:hypothetical protein